jgi:hypothetical protein
MCLLISNIQHTFSFHLFQNTVELTITNSSFIRYTVKEWNKLDIAIRKLDSLSKFINVLRLNTQSNQEVKP